MSDSMKVIYAKMMMAAAPMFEKLQPQDQVKVVERVANDLMRKIQGEQGSKNDSHIIATDAE